MDAPAGEIRISSLSASQSLLLSIYRQWLKGLECRDSRYWEAAWREASRALGGSAGRAALTSLECLLRRIASHAVRSISYHPPCCGYLAGDESLLLEAVAAAGRKESEIALLRLVSRDGLAEVCDAARDLACAFAEGGQALRQPDVELSSQSASGIEWVSAAPTLH